jgi:hypothetical protein
MKMDGCDVLIGDRVQDVIFGAGVVDKINEDEGRFWVLMAGRNECYDSKGNGRFGVRTLYWRDPIIVAPAKNETTWEQVSAIATAAYKILGDKK